MLVICHFHIYMTEAGVMQKTGYIYSTWSTTSHLDDYIYLIFIIREVLLTKAH